MLTNCQVFSHATEFCVRGGVTLSETDDPETLREKFARVIVDDMYHFVGLLDVNGMILEINRAAVVGIQMDQVRGTPFWDADWWGASQETRAAVHELIRHAGKGEFVRCDFKVYSRLAPEETICVDFSLLPIRNHGGEIVFLLPEGRNITEKKRAEAEIARKNEELQASHELTRQQCDELQILYEKIVTEQRLSERLLLNLLPYPIAERLKVRPDHC